jgi:hypothetical protein
LSDVHGRASAPAENLERRGLLARGAGGGVHNPVYMRELIYDSVFAVTGAAPATIPVRP